MLKQHLRTTQNKKLATATMHLVQARPLPYLETASSLPLQFASLFEKIHQMLYNHDDKELNLGISHHRSLIQLMDLLNRNFVRI